MYFSAGSFILLTITFKIKNHFAKYFRESWLLCSNECFSFKYFNSDAFASKISPKLSNCFWPL